MASVVAEIAQGAAGGLLGGIKSILGTFVADKSEDAKDKAAYALQDLIGRQAEVQAQLAINQAEAASPDRLNHWRGGLGWTLVLGVLWQMVVVPVMVMFGKTLPTIPDQYFNALIDLVLTLVTGHAITGHVMPGISRMVAARKG